MVQDRAHPRLAETTPCHILDDQLPREFGYSPHEPFLGRPAWFLHAPYPEDTNSTVGNWVREQQAKVDKAQALLQRVSERRLNKTNKHRVPASYQEGDWVLVHHNRLPAGHALPAMTPTSGPTRFSQWMDTVLR